MFFWYCIILFIVYNSFFNAQFEECLAIDRLVLSLAKYMVPPKVFTFQISKLHSILAIANLLAHNNISQICYCGQFSLQSAAVNCSFSDNLTFFGVTFILLAMVPYRANMITARWWYRIFEYLTQP